MAAVFDAFFATYQAAIADLIRIATAGSGQLAPGPGAWPRRPGWTGA